MSAAVWGGNSSGQYGAGYSGGGRLHMPTRASHMIQLLGGIDFIHTTYGALYGLHQGHAAVCGGDVTGVTGTGVRKARQIEPSIIPIDEPVLQITAAGARWLALLESGKFSTCGANVEGQLGNGTSGYGHEASGSAVPVYLDPPKPIKQVIAGGGTNALLFQDNTIATWGEGKTAQLGYGAMAEQRTPREVPELTGVKQLSLGGISSLTGHALALMEDGTVKAWGANGQGQCALPVESSLKTNHGWVIEKPITVAGLPSDIVAVAAGATHSLALDANGDVYAWGANGCGQLGIEPAGEGHYDPVPKLIAQGISAIDAGLRFTVLVRASNGAVVVFGDNLHGVLGASAGEYSSIPHEVGIAGATQISAGEDSCACLLTGWVPGPCVELEPGKELKPGTLRMVWHSSLKTKWAVGIRTQTPTSAEREEWSSVTEGIAASAPHEFTFTGLTPGMRYEALLRGSGFGECILEGAAV